MKRIWVNLGVTAATVLVTGAIVSACAHNDASIFIRQVLAPTLPSNGACTFTADPTAGALSGGEADLSFANLSTYTPEILVGNQIITQANSNALQAETSRVIINGAITRYTDLAGGDIISLLQDMCAAKDAAACATGKAVVASKTIPINPFSTVESGALEPSTGTSPTYVAMGVTMVDSATVDVLRTYFMNAVTMNLGANGDTTAYSSSIQLKTYTKMEGVTLGGDTVESNEFEFPVTFTYGGLVANLAASSSIAGGYCLDTSIMLPTAAQTCTYGQEVPVIVGSFPGLADCPSADGG